jgi:hypothetical protein
MGLFHISTIPNLILKRWYQPSNLRGFRLVNIVQYVLKFNSWKKIVLKTAEFTMATRSSASMIQRKETKKAGTKRKRNESEDSGFNPVTVLISVLVKLYYIPLIFNSVQIKRRKTSSFFILVPSIKKRLV